MEVPETPGSGQQANQIDWEARYKGASQKINELMNRITELEGQLSSRASEVEQHKASLSIKDVEKDAAINSYKTQLEAALAKSQQDQSELRELRALKSKLDIAKKLGASHLVPILDKIPYVDNPEAMEDVVKSFMDWGKDLVKERESQLLAGVTPASPAAVTTPALPTSSKDWEAYVNSQPFGPEREKAYQQWFTWGASQK